MGHALIHYAWLGLILFVTAFIVTWGIYPTVLRMSRVWKIYDNPDWRKLQRNPVPVLGGLAVYCGILIDFLIICTISFDIQIIFILLAMSILLAVGVTDDKKGLSVKLRFAIEILVVSGMMIGNGNMIDHFHGLFGLEEIPLCIAFPLSVVAGVGLINAINFIDGVNGYSSGFVIVACVMFSVIFYAAHITRLALICLVCAGALVPFFLHNVFGKKSLMFIGDGGTLMMGTFITAFIFSTLNSHSPCCRLEQYNIGLIPVCIAILSIPVFDTLRVMVTRICSGHSPFLPDKTHLHHLFIDLGFSHAMTSLLCIFLNALVVLILYVSWRSGADIDLQLYIVCGTAVLFTFILYPILRFHEHRKTKLYLQIVGITKRLAVLENGKFWQWMQKLVDDELFINGRHTY